MSEVPCLCGNPSCDTIPAEVIERAREATCSRCKEVIVDSPGKFGTVFVNTYVPAIGARERLMLCGPCGLAYREFVHPELAEDPHFQAIKAELLGRFM